MEKSEQQKVRYAVVGLGHIAQSAVLPAFKNARDNSELVALVSGDPVKLKRLGKKYDVDLCYSYDEFEDLLLTGEVDAVYIATPNTKHRQLAEIAADCGVHILCEKPLATDAESCMAVIEAAKHNNVKLMVAYRLHFEAANLKAMEVARGGKLGALRIFNSVFSMQVTDPDNIRLKRRLGGGPLYDIGIYCINASRYLFEDEPEEVVAMSVSSSDPRFSEIDEMTAAILRFPNDRLANFTVSFGAADASEYELVGTKGRLCLANAYDYAEPMEMNVEIGRRVKTKKYKKRDQFSAELLYFSDCIVNDVEPEPSGYEGLADIRIIEALQQSLDSGRPVRMGRFKKVSRPTVKQKITRPAINPPLEIHTAGPRGD